MEYMIKLRFILFATLISFVGCNKDDGGNCPNVTLNRERLINPIGAIEVTDVVLRGDCVEVAFIVTDGCNNTEPDVELFYDEGYLDSFPPLKRLRISYNETSTCNDTYPRKATFDLSPLRHPVHDQLRIQVFGWDGELRYEY